MLYFFKTLFYRRTCLLTGSGCWLPLGSSVLSLVSRVTAREFPSLFVFKKVLGGKCAILQFSAFEIMQSSSRCVWDSRPMDLLPTNYLSLASLNSGYDVHAGRIFFVVQWISPFWSESNWNWTFQVCWGFRKGFQSEKVWLEKYPLLRFEAHRVCM